jgi:two-component system LytT family response regulator
MIRTLIVDDEEPARDRLRQLLSSIDDVNIVGEAEDGEQAIQQILELRPDLVFLDIQMPACSGLEVAASLPSPRPRIIFCTAFDQYAVDAFELHAIDYLLKPVSRARLADALSRARQAQPDTQESGLETFTQAALGHRFLAKRGARFRVSLEPRCCTCFRGRTRKLCGGSALDGTHAERSRSAARLLVFRVSRRHVT